jgi:DNA (cytosine-5)-methyltransferase 1
MLTSVELFAGAGGLGMGLTLAGFRHLAVIERDQWACDTIRRNQARGHELVAGWPLYQGDVRHFDYDAIADQVDVVAGGPPCQPFSMGGRHQGNRDDRDMFPAMAEAVRRLRPRAFIVENVKGLTRPGFADYLDYIVARLECPEVARGGAENTADHRRRLQQYKRSGRRSGARYDVTVHLVNAADYGVPQKRARVFIIGIRNDLVLRWRFPGPTHSRDALLHDQWISFSYWHRHRIPHDARPPAPNRMGSGATLREAPALRAWRTVRDALGGLPDPECDGFSSSRIADHHFQPGVRFYPGHTGSSLDLPAKTLKAGDHGVPGGENALVRADGTGRYFTVRESARLQTFRDDYVFAGAWSEAMRQLGNAVPVALAHAVAASLATALIADDTARSPAGNQRVAEKWPLNGSEASVRSNLMAGPTRQFTPTT